MAKMKAIEAAVRVLEKEGVTVAFGVPGAAINPLYAALKDHGGIGHILARHVEGASHMAEGYTRAVAGNIGRGFDSDSLHHGPGAAFAAAQGGFPGRGHCLHRQDRDQVGHHGAGAGPGAARLPAGLPPDALWPSRPGADRSAHRRAAGRDRVRHRHLRAPAGLQAGRHAQAGRKGLRHASTKSSDPLAACRADRRDQCRMPAGAGRAGRAAQRARHPHADGTGHDLPTTIPLMAGMCGLQTSHRYGNATMLASDFVLGIGNRWANRHTGSVEVYTKGRKFVHVDIEPTQIGRVFAPDYGIVSDAGAALQLFVEVARDWKAAGRLKDRSGWVAECQARKNNVEYLRKTNFDNVPMKPQRVYQCMNRSLDKDTCYVSTIGLSQIAGAQFLHVYKPRNWINCGQAGPLGWTVPAALGVRVADPARKIVALSGDYDFQFMIEELAVGAQFKLPYIHVLVNNSYLGLIRQAQRAFSIDYCVQLAFDNINVDDKEESKGYGVDHVKVVEGLGCKAIRVHRPEDFALAMQQAEAWMAEHRTPVVVEVILERVTNISMGTEIDNIVEFEDLATGPADVPSALALLD
ncbi:hypothetical protein FQR65_LT20120 [Abscondita terminalis]|nr:hypothetical protein FQR65_LT20120 [Abscondita terminalis]